MRSSPVQAEGSRLSAWGSGENPGVRGPRDMVPVSKRSDGQFVMKRQNSIVNGASRASKPAPQIEKKPFFGRTLVSYWHSRTPWNEGKKGTL